LTNVEPSGTRRELHLCEPCAEKAKILVKKEFNLSSIIQTLVGAQLGGQADEMAALTCPACGMRYGDFRSEGRLGCPHDYEVFRAGLTPLLKRIHQAAQHVGKSPRRDHEATKRHHEMIDLRRQLREAVDNEAFERAASIRDVIRAKESQG